MPIKFRQKQYKTIVSTGTIVCTFFINSVISSKLKKLFVATVTLIVNGSKA